MRPNFHPYGVIQSKEVAGRNISNLILVINILSSSREDGLKRMNGGYTIIWLSLEMEAWKRPFKHSPCVLQVHIFLHNNIT